MKAKLHYVLTTAMLLFVFSAFAQTNFFVKVSNNKSLQKSKGNKQESKKGVYYKFDYNAFAEVLATQNQKASSVKTSNLILEFPNEAGELEDFQIIESSVLHPDLQSKYPEIKSFIGINVNNPAVHMRFSLSPYNGLSAVVLGKANTLVYEPVKNQTNLVLVTTKNDIISNTLFSCESLGANLSQTLKLSATKSANDSNKRTYKLALSVTGEYAQANGGTLASVNAAINATLTNVNAVFENDFNVSLQLIPTNDDVVYLNPSTDPYTSLSNYNAQLANTLDSVILEANYDIGHLLAGVNDSEGNGTGDSGCIGCVCNNGGSYGDNNHKGSGFTTSSEPSGINFDLNFVAHEIAHQFGATHTWTYSSNEGFNSHMEPGSGSTIMGYAGITESYNLQINSDPYFHAISIQQVTTYINSTSCATITNTGNTTPIVSAGSNLTLPIGTAFKLTGSASDADDDVLTYCWEQFNEDNANTSYPNPNSSNSNSVLFRSFLPAESDTRYFPNLSDLRFGVNTTQWEKIPNVSRTADFRLTVRDNKPGGGNNDYDDMRVTFNDSYGPFEVTSQNTSSQIWVSGTSKVITWNVNNTDQLSGASQVNIWLSTDGGLTFDTLLASNVLNNGAYTITVPEISAAYCRVMIEPTAHQFFAINTHDFSINYDVQKTCTQYSSASNLGLSITDNGRAFTQNHTINIGDSSTISDLNIGVNISHDYIGDLEFSVVSPNNTEVLLKFNNDCGGQENIIVVYDDEAKPFNCENSNSGSSFKSSNDLLSLFNGENINGDWTIRLGDFYAGDIGVLNSWYVEVCETTLSTSNSENTDTDLGLLVFPNPSHDGNFVLKMNNPSGKDIYINVFDVSNRLVYEEIKTGVTHLEQVLDLKQLQSGMYILYLDNGVNTFTRKIIIK